MQIIKKQTASKESGSRWLLFEDFECSQIRILSANSNVTDHLVLQHNKQYHRKVLLSGLRLNGHTLEFHPQTQKLEPPCTA